MFYLPSFVMDNFYAHLFRKTSQRDFLCFHVDLKTYDNFMKCNLRPVTPQHCHVRLGSLISVEIKGVLFLYPIYALFFVIKFYYT